MSYDKFFIRMPIIYQFITKLATLIRIFRCFSCVPNMKYDTKRNKQFPTLNMGINCYSVLNVY